MKDQIVIIGAGPVARVLGLEKPTQEVVTAEPDVFATPPTPFIAIPVIKTLGLPKSGKELRRERRKRERDFKKKKI